MDELSQNVQNTKVSLVASSRELQEVEKRAESSINQDLDGMRRTLLNGYSKMQHLCEQTDLFLFQIKLQDNAQELVDLKPQLLWLNTYVDQIAENLEVAQQKATFALTTATDFDYKIMDISQKTEVNRSRLEDAQRTGQIMANAARSQLDSSERALTSAKKDLAAKNHEIQSKRRDADAKRIRKNEMESDVSEKNRKIEQVRRKAASKKDKAAVSAVSAP